MVPMDFYLYPNPHPLASRSQDMAEEYHNGRTYFNVMLLFLLAFWHQSVKNILVAVVGDESRLRSSCHELFVLLTMLAERKLEVKIFSAECFFFFQYC